MELIKTGEVKQIYMLQILANDVGWEELYNRKISFLNQCAMILITVIFFALVSILSMLDFFAFYFHFFKINICLVSVKL